MIKGNYQKALHNAICLYELINTNRTTHIASYLPDLNGDQLKEIENNYRNGSRDARTVQVMSIIQNAHQQLALAFSPTDEYEKDELKIFLNHYTDEIADIAIGGRNTRLIFNNVNEELRAYFDLLQESATDRFLLSHTIRETWKRHLYFKKNFYSWIKSNINDEEEKLKFSLNFIENRRHSLEIPQQTPRFNAENTIDTIVKTLMFSHEKRRDIFKTIKLGYGNHIKTTNRNKGRKQTNIVLDEKTHKMLNDFLVKNKEKKNEMIARAIQEYIQSRDR